MTNTSAKQYMSNSNHNTQTSQDPQASLNMTKNMIKPSGADQLNLADNTSQNHKSGNHDLKNIVHIGKHTYDLNDHTPMMVQYLTMKAQYPNALLLYRMGDFYELFFEDAHRAAHLLDITLTRRGVDKSGNTIAMAGVPFHAADSYMARLIAAGQTVVICEQIDENETDLIENLNATSTPSKATKSIKTNSTDKKSEKKDAKKGIMRREVVKTLTAGTLTDDALIAPDQTPTVAAINIFTQTKNKSVAFLAGISQLDLNAGSIRTQSLSASSEDDLKHQILTVLSRFAPSEAIIPEILSDNWRHWLQSTLDYPVVSVAKSDFHPEHAKGTLCKQFDLQTIEGIGIEGDILMQTSSAALIHYAQQTQQRHIPQINELIVERNDDYLIIDDVSSRNLELFAPVSPNGTALIQVINHCKTAMGKRLLSYQLKRPLRIGSGKDNNKASDNLDTLSQRLDAIEWLTHLSEDGLLSLQNKLSVIADIERISSRIGLHSAKPRDLRRLCDSIYASGELDDLLRQQGLNPNAKGLLALLQMQLPNEHAEISDIANLIDSAIVTEPPAHIRDGGMIATGYDEDLDRLTHLHDNIQQTLDTMLESERSKNQLVGLKIGFNKVSGFYFELPKAQVNLAPAYFIRRQTLKNCERYVTEDLKNLEIEYLDAQTNALAREKALYKVLLHKLNEGLNHIQRLSSAVAQLDVLINWALLAKQNNWTRPILEPTKSSIKIKDGRHLVVESRLQQMQTSPIGFIANDCELATQTHPEKLMLITGPNMGGKSTYMRQTALIIILGCCGSFVPASQAVIGDIDRIFTRIGSADDLAGGKSTFMVEMIETAQILNLATQNSLVLMDEVGRGTSTTDGLAIAHACVLKLADLQCLTLFATHYFELTQLATDSTELLPNPPDLIAHKIRNVHVSATEVDGKLLLLHKIKQGAASSSFGLHVAQIAGIPTDVLQNAKAYLDKSNDSKSQKALVDRKTGDNIFNSQNNTILEDTNIKSDLVNAKTAFDQILNPADNDPIIEYSVSNTDTTQSSLNNVCESNQAQYDIINKRLHRIDLDELSPKQALDTLYELKQLMSL